MINILFIPDINGRIGRLTVAKILPPLKKKLKIDLVIANADNIAHGHGATKTSIQELLDVGIDWFTGGDHSFDKEKQINDIYQGQLPILRPANYSDACPGNGWTIISREKYNILVISLIGRVFMKLDYNCPFAECEKILASFAKQNLSAIIVDIHAEATAEKIALKHFLDGKVSAIFGTHTHVMTADNQITSSGTAYITDAGMVGADDSVLGVDKENIIKTFLSQIKHPHIIPEKGQSIFNAVFASINPRTKKAESLKPIIKYIKIN